MSQRSGILLFNSRGTCTRCLGSRRHFNVNVGFTDNDLILIENLHIFKGYGAKELIKEFPDKCRVFSVLYAIASPSVCQTGYIKQKRFKLGL